MTILELIAQGIIEADEVYTKPLDKACRINAVLDNAGYTIVRKRGSKALTPYEQWMVESNLKTIRAGTAKDQIVATLRTNGYTKIANAVELAKA